MYFRIRGLLRRVSRIAVKSDPAFNSIAPFSVGNCRLKLTAGRERAFIPVSSCAFSLLTATIAKKKRKIVRVQRETPNAHSALRENETRRQIDKVSPSRNIYRAYRSTLIEFNYASFFLSCARARGTRRLNKLNVLCKGLCAGR